jgi:bifunctional DNA-binding transcriptional regulator/antitoxin component of YhaV-PrlF toxin-antitoxin module
MSDIPFIATVLEDGRVTIPRAVAKAKKAKKGKTFHFVIKDEVKV